MAKWDHTIDFMSFWNDDDMSIGDKGKAVAAEIKRVFPTFGNDDELEEIVDGFEHDVGKYDVLAFDCLLENLYDWADENRVWVATTFK